MNRDQVQGLTGDANRWLDALNAAAERWGLNTPDRLAMFLAQCAHESGGFRTLVESLHYSAARLLEVWPKRFTPDEAVRMAYDERAIAERAYSGRMGNGPEGLGDGYRFRGRGLIQLTGRDNYTRCAQALGADIVERPELLEQARWAALSAGWFWSTRGCNELADAGDYLAITKRINGGVNGLADREAWLKTVRTVLSSSSTEPSTQPAAPIEDRGTEYQEPTKEKYMDPIIAISIFGPLISQLIPQVAKIFGGGEKAKQNVAAATTVLDTVVKAAEAANEQEAISKMQADPAVLERVTKAVVTEPSIMAILEIGGGIAAARQATKDLVTAAGDRWWMPLCTPIMIMSLALCAMLIMVLGNVLGMPWGGNFQSWSENTRSNVVFAVITGAIGAITGYWFGTTVTSNKKDSIIAAQAEGKAP